MKITILQPQIIQGLGNRSNQEDSVFPKQDEATGNDRLFVLCDGMGGHENGEVASQLVCGVLPEYIRAHWHGGFFPDGLLQDALNEVNSRINEYPSESIRKMGTTLTFLCIHQGGVLMAHIGDSRIYHIRPSEHLIIYKSRDHSLAYDLYMAGEIEYEDIATYKKNVITRAIMPGQENPYKADIAHTTDVKPGDYFLLCSDGLLENMSDVELVNLLRSDLDNDQKREQLIENSKDNKDNHSAILLQISKVAKDEEDLSYINDETTNRSNAIVFEKKISEFGSNKLSSIISQSPQKPLYKILLWILAVIVLLILIIKFYRYG